MSENKKTNVRDELTEIYLMKDNDRYKGDVFVCVNGVGMMVPRGEHVKIKKKYADVIKRSMEAANAAASYSESLSEDME